MLNLVPLNVCATTLMTLSSLYDEFEALEAIYSDDGFTYNVQEVDNELVEVSVSLGEKVVRLRIPRGYPDVKPSSRNELINAIIEETWTPGSECLFQIMEKTSYTAEDLHVEKGEAVEETEQPTYFGVRREEKWDPR